MYAKLADLPASIVNALNANGYYRPDVEVIAAETYTIGSGGASFTGNRAFCTAVNLATGERMTTIGSWSGANPFENKQADHDEQPRPIVPNMVVIKGESGYKAFARVYVAPGTMAAMLPAPSVELTDAAIVVLHCLKAYKSAYRKDEAARYGVNAELYASTLVDLASKGLVKVSSNGASQITTEGKNALTGRKLPKPTGW